MEIDFEDGRTVLGESHDGFVGDQGEIVKFELSQCQLAVQLGNTVGAGCSLF